MESSPSLFTYILSGDRDSFQLISDKTSVVIPTTKKGITEYTTYTPEKLDEIYNIKPSQVIEVKALMGDSADNIPGIKGVGEKTALKLLHEYGTIENLKEHMHEIKGKMGEKIRDNIDQGLLSKKIATIIKDVPMEVDLDDFCYQGFDYNELAEFYRHYSMNSASSL